MSDQHLDYQWFLDDANELLRQFRVALHADQNLSPGSDIEHALDQAEEALREHHYLPQSPQQEIQTELFFAERFRLRDQRDTTADRNWQSLDFLGQAALHYERGAEIAVRIEDWLHVAECKYMLAAALMGSKPYRARYRLAYEATAQALAARLKLPNRTGVAELAYIYHLADRLAIRSVIVGEDKDAVEALELAAFVLFELREHDDFPAADNENFMMFLDWDWATLYSSLGHYRLAFRCATRAHRQLGQNATVQNKLRLARVIAAIGLNLADSDEVGQESGTYRRLLRVVGNRISDFNELIADCEDQPAYALMLLAHARWGAMSGVDDEQTRLARLDEAQAIAGAENDMILFAQVEIARGEEHEFKRQYDDAKRLYETAAQRLAALGCEDRARFARRKLQHLLQLAGPDSPLTLPTISQDDISLN